MSGSIGEVQGKDFLGEVKGIMEEYPDYNIKVWCFDTKCTTNKILVQTTAKT